MSNTNIRLSTVGTKKVISYTAAIFLVLLSLCTRVSAVEIIRGVIQQTFSPKCPQSNCDRFYINPDSGYEGTSLQYGLGNELRSYIGLHVEVTGFRNVWCDTCKIFSVTNISLLSINVADYGAQILPRNIALEQNYPNPFNPTTIIRYSIQSAGLVHLVIFDIVGRQIETLVSTKQIPGNYQIQWNAQNAVSGIYFYRINFCGMDGNNFVETKAMLLLR